jgi:hypothetical protein
MTIQYSVTVQNAQLAAIANNFEQFTDQALQIYTAPIPANAGNSYGSSVKLLEIPLPLDMFGVPSGGVMTKSGTWQGTAIATGTAAYFRMTGVGAGTADVQGSVGTSGADMIVDNTAFVIGQIFTVLTFTVTHNQG